MFAQQLRQEGLFQKTTHIHLNPLPSQTYLLTQTDLQYEICGTFLKQTGRELSTREADLMETSKAFIDCFSNFKKKQIDSSRTLDTYLEQSKDPLMSSEEDSSFVLPRNKSPQVGSRRSSQAASQQLREIQQNCSYACQAFVNSLVAEYKTLEGRLRFYQSRQMLMGRRDERGMRLQQQNLILTKKLQLQQLKIQQLQAEIELLKQKNKSINSGMNNKINLLQHSHKYFEINNKVYKDIKNYLQEKQQLLKLQAERIGTMENEVMRTIEKAFEENACHKCCEILRKLKESILKFRRYLEGESQEFEKLYDKYKKTMYSIKSRPSI